MKTYQKNTNTINSYLRSLLTLSFALGLGACGLNSSEEGTIRANLRGSSNGGGVTSLNSGGKAIDLPTNRPAPTSTKWTFVDMMSVQKSGTNGSLEDFLSLSDGQSVSIDPSNYNYVDIIFWGDMKSTGSVLQVGNAASEQAFFSSLDKNSFAFEMVVWDYYTNTQNAQGQKYDYLGYAYFGKGLSSVQAGELSDVVYVPHSTSPQVHIRFRDNLGDIVIATVLNRSTREMTGTVYYRSTGQPLKYLGNFSRLRVCEMFKCS